MLYDIHTYDVKPRAVAELEGQVAEVLPTRLEISPLGGFWHTEVGPLNQIIHIWPYENMEHRTASRALMNARNVWGCLGAEFLVNMQSDIYLPAPFMRPLGEAEFGPIYEMRTYTYRSGDISKVIDAWGDAIEEREKYSPLVGAFYSDAGSMNRWTHIWAYESFEQRMQVREETRERGIWPPTGAARPLQQESKILLPAEFSPLQ
ncbi:MAG: NIPSNAP family protein [Chloroflexi bacterium]|nr:NIPSNAP family protein [Chloroflexota bacterium]